MNNTINNTNLISKMKENNNTTVWVNHYNRHGQMTESIPYQSFADAINATEELVTITNQFMPKHLQYTRTGEFYWEDGRDKGSTIQIQLVGNPLLYLRNEWIAISANYSDEIPRSDWFINLLYQWYGLDTDGLERFAEQFYEERLNRVFLEEDEMSED